jgi:hypothetical protein
MNLKQIKNSMSTYLEIVSIETNKVVKRLDLTGMSDRYTERTELGMLMTIDRDRFFVNENKTEDKLELI